ncbi:MAG: indolepyruvate oxidoreductase subunit beta [Desulfobacterales bacterium]|jgi:indolepyruvate ferredoxin oxidoreductase beta subunit|nr:indolepyruvate oxidoreductase subunit beta [Desulfobacterales bacterium]MDH3878099.1 indolepyruvate oxidoreductase subunit beta [Desulfobacterales bacterium]
MEPKKIVVIGVGGQGNLLATNLLGEAALSLGMPVVASEIHGMAQRGGIVESAVLLGDISSPIISPGESDVFLSFEPLETLRGLSKCNRKTVVITNTRSMQPFTAALGQGVYPPLEKMMSLIKSKIDKVIAFDGSALAEKAGNPLSLNMVMLGALIGSETIPISAADMKETISTSTKKAFLESNLKAFDLGFAAVQ